MFPGEECLSDPQQVRKWVSKWQEDYGMERTGNVLNDFMSFAYCSLDIYLMNMESGGLNLTLR